MTHASRPLLTWIVGIVPLVASLVGGAALDACTRAEGDPANDRRPPGEVPASAPRWTSWILNAPRAGVDCHLIAQSLTSIELGNYAEPDERAPREAELTRLCEQTPLTADDASCIVASKTKDALASCDKPMIVAHLQQPVVQRPMVPAFARTGALLPAACQSYFKQLERFTTCAAVPAASRTAIADAVRQAAEGWGQLPPEALAAVATTCAQAEQSIGTALQSLNCQ